MVSDTKVYLAEEEEMGLINNATRAARWEGVVVCM
jgi:hypothetical protein